MADLLGADPRGIVFGRSATSLTYDLARALAKDWGPGDEVVVTRLDHDANIRPWVQAAEAAGATVRWVDFDPATGELVRGCRGRRALRAHPAGGHDRRVEPDRHPPAGLPGGRPGPRGRRPALGRRRARHRPRLGRRGRPCGADFWTCSPYKFMGPHCGVLAADPALLETLHPDKLLPSTDAVPERFELGTLPYELMAGTTAAVDFIATSTTPARARRRRERIELRR